MADIDGIIRQLKCSHFLLELQKGLQTEIKKTSLYSGDVKLHVKKYIKDTGYAVLLQNIIFKCFTEPQSNVIGEEVEPLDYVRKAQEKGTSQDVDVKNQKNWEKCIVKSINSMCTELALPLARKRTSHDQQVLAEKFNSMTLGAEYNDEMYEKLRPVYSAADFFEVVIGVKNNNLSQVKKSSFKSWFLIDAQLHSPSYDDVEKGTSQDVDVKYQRKDFPTLTGTHHQIGIDDTTESTFEMDWLKVGHKVAATKHMGAARQYLKQGCIPGLRKVLWSTVFHIDLTDVDVCYYEQLKSFVFEYDMLVDYLVMKDVRLTATNDDSFFVFEDVLYQVLLVFSRDTTILDHFTYSSATPPKSYIRGKIGVEDNCVNYPPCGIFPFHGFSMLAAPLCYIFDKPVELYFVFRHLYVRYFFRLHTISSHPQGILSLCALFEKLLQAQDATVYKHLLDIGAQPLRLVFNWFLFAYSGYLATDETLKLWDRVIGYNSLQILSRVGIVSYRRDNLLSVSTQAACEAVLADISTIKVIPILVNMLSTRTF